MTIHRVHESQPRRGSVLLAAVVLGVGMGALLDGIVFHRILGWHHLVSGWTQDPAANRLADGLFDAAAWLTTLAGVVLLWRAWRRWGEPRPTSRLAGGMLAGWGGFSFVESVVDHHVLGLHHVAHDASLAWDLGILLASAALFLVGVRLARRSTKAAREAERRGVLRA
ncbi:MAG TPA: DUF2243 domain-containing protein [Candidatus Thermoplasmatota archaeon]|nr:DUF2243 domain-containing protein [Candidatus Thermoplasmatota archaeon]